MSTTGQVAEIATTPSADRAFLRGVSFFSDLLDRVRTNLVGRLEERGIGMSLDSAVDVPVPMDRERVLRVLVNLCDNSRKAIREGGALTLTAVRDGARVRISVVDEGEGMSPQVLERFLEPFYSSSGGGVTGLGMVIVKNVVETHDGALEVESTVREGTRITLTLPLEPAGTAST